MGVLTLQAPLAWVALSYMQTCKSVTGVGAHIT